mmetsp:Transcript_16798/g.33565  ORF Transcript_16798/g.33565 Transcript_16798/m.33565 type:complete len:223 (+) Transcript_16798:377-1045(+)
MQHNTSVAAQNPITRKLDADMKIAIGEVMTNALIPPHPGNCLGPVCGKQVISELDLTPVGRGSTNYPHSLGGKLFLLPLVGNHDIGMLPEVIRKPPPLRQVPSNILHHCKGHIGRDGGIDITDLGPQKRTIAVAVSIGRSVDDNNVLLGKSSGSGRQNGLLNESNRGIAAGTEQEEEGIGLCVSTISWWCPSSSCCCVGDGDNGTFRSSCCSCCCCRCASSR